MYVALLDVPVVQRLSLTLNRIMIFAFGVILSPLQYPPAYVPANRDDPLFNEYSQVDVFMSPQASLTVD